MSPRNASADSVDRERVERALRGELLYGDDFSPAEIDAWFADEREGYFDLYYGDEAADGGSPPSSEGWLDYGYRALVERHGYRWLPAGPIGHLLGIGSATGGELVPLLARAREVTILEPSAGFQSRTLQGKPVRWLQPQASGLMPMADASVDVIVCLSVLHHVPNVSTVLREMARVLRPGGHAVLREPTHSMGDWRRPRSGLTLRERGIPRQIFGRIVRDSGFQVLRQTRCMFSLTSRLGRFTRRPVWAIDSIVALDEWLCRLPLWPERYHARNALDKLRPTALALVLRKP